MDTLTHALSGALAARAAEPRGGGVLPRRTRMTVGFWAAAFPDSDFVLRFADPLTYLTTHRGVTHSVLLLPLWAVALAVAFHWLYRRRYPWQAFVGVCALSLGAHIAGDVITSFGTMIFAPFSDWRAQLPSTFIIDPYFTAIIAVGLLAARYWHETRAPALAALVVLGAYVGFQTVLHGRAVELGRAYAAAQQLPDSRAYALPQPFSPFHWLIVVEDRASYHLSYVSLLRRRVPDVPPDAGFLCRVYGAYRPVAEQRWERVPRYGSLPQEAGTAQAALQSPAFAQYLRFAMFPAAYRVERFSQRACVYVADLRFALDGRRMPFRYAACRENEGAPWRLYAVATSDDGSDVLEPLPRPRGPLDRF